LNESLKQQFFIIALIFFVPLSLTQINLFQPKFDKIIWKHTFDRSTWEGANKIIQTSDGGFALAGTRKTDSANTPVKTHDMLFMKTDEEGEIKWVQIFGGAFHDEAFSLIQTSDGGFALAGYSDVEYGTWFQPLVWLLKFDNTGKLKWNCTYEEFPNLEARKIIQTNDGGFLLMCSNTYAYLRGGAIQLLKTDSKGKIEWNKTIDHLVLSTHDIISTDDGNYILVGYIVSNYNHFHVQKFSHTDILMLKIDSIGNIQWQQVFGSFFNEATYSVIQTFDGGFALISQINNHMILMKTNEIGELEWNRSYREDTPTFAASLIETFDNGFVLLGGIHNYKYEEVHSDIYVVGTDSKGKMKWEFIFENSEVSWAYSIIQISNTNFVLAGYLKQGESDRSDIDVLLLSFNPFHEDSLKFFSNIFQYSIIVIDVLILGYILRYLKKIRGEIKRTSTDQIT
jgi:hypothetical protein